ncbi:hypothetical protein PCC7424_3201 [Gloeothece citriformis PCC 7424]|uniref:Uncharacterized protein n=1 Tax=Gloeothece citriformis (strain PCC 7424) TaxID=65393 RepID=B7KCQ1_GLOC7|nr:hypothetical protein [Gloeothece citriformis]ACK71602.1 hypothetical protein PCC7424_3201 [Gloeothece citriformis PCC 7424]
MDEYLKTLQSLSQSMDQALQNPQNSTEEKQFVSHLSNSVGFCVDEISKSANTLKKIVDVSLDDLNKAEAILQNYYKISREVSPLTPLEEIGKLSGCQVKLLELIEVSKKDIFEQLKGSWKENFDDQIKQWFIDKKGNIKKEIGWIEKDNFLKGIKSIKQNQIERAELLFKSSYKLIIEQLKLIIDFKDLQYILQIFDDKQQKIYKNLIYNIWKKINNALFVLENPSQDIEDLKYILRYRRSRKLSCSPSSYPPILRTKLYNLDVTNISVVQEFEIEIDDILSPICNIIWGYISWNLVIKTQLQYNSIIESFINESFQKKSKLITYLIQRLIKVYNDFLQQQAFYNQQSPEEQQAKQEWLNTQRQQLKTLQSSLDNVISFQL